MDIDHPGGVDIVGSLPSSFFDVRFVGEMVPGHRPEMGLTAGSNCQRYAYAVLRHFGLSVPDLRSSDLWVDQGSTMAVANPAALDLVLYAPTRDPWGAHVGVFLGGSSVLHLCQEVGVPAVWDFDDFADRDRYREQLGFKRVRRPDQDSGGCSPQGLGGAGR